jgi:Protein of unknown function (DUF2948)
VPPDGPLRLRAEDAEDLAVISACVQDALVSVRDLAYDPEARTFVLVANRFRWEAAKGGEGKAGRFERTLCAIAFGEVENVAYRGFQRSDEARMLCLLAIRPANTAPGSTIDLDFSESATIRLSAAAIRCRARDFGEPWPTAFYPDHPDGTP